MSSYTINLKRCSEVYGKDEILSWFTDYEEKNYLTADQYNLISRYNSYGFKAFDKNLLSKMIFEHYYFREIGYETPEMFRHYAKVKLQEIMGKYLPLIYSSAIQYDPLTTNTFNLKETLERTRDDKRTDEFSENTTKEGNSEGTQQTDSTGTSSTRGNSSSTSSSNSSGLQINNDTPQGQINKQNILNGSYASSTSANENENSITDSTTSSSSNSLDNHENKTDSSNTTEHNTTSNTGNSEETQNEKYTKERSGYDLKISNAEKILQFRKTIQNYYYDIIEECNSLFFALF